MLNLTDKINKKISVYRAEEEEDIGYISSIQEVHDDYLAITVPLSKRVPLSLRAGDKIKIKIIGEGEIFILSHSFVGLRKDNIPLYIISLPEHVKRIQQRNYVRFSCVLNVNYKSKECKDYSVGRSLDISGGGMKLVVHSPIEEGTILRVSFNLPGDKEPIELDAEVVRSSIMEVTAGKLNCVGLKFLDIEQWVQEHIISFIFTKMAEQRRMMR